MLLELRNIKQAIGNNDLKGVIAKYYGLSDYTFAINKIIHRSIDARKKQDIHYVYTVIIEIAENKAKKLIDSKNVLLYEEEATTPFSFGNIALNNSPIIVGSGPAGIFMALELAEQGYKPIILERGYDIDKRDKAILDMEEKGIFDPISNIVFGEGGAGTYSDGKLTTRIKDKRSNIVLKRFVEFGADSDILYVNKPHIGTDVLKGIIKRMREHIIKLGGQVIFESQVTDIIVDNGNIKGVIINNEQKLYSDIVCLAIGHSARDTYEMLYERGLEIAQKPFAIGLRIEHEQSLINEKQYGNKMMADILGAADYKLTYRSAITGRSAYSFCMCPGGSVVSGVSEPEHLVVNGMSKHARAGKNANSAIVVGINTNDFKSDHPLAGIDFQRVWEKLAFELGGKNYSAPVQLVGDFLRGETTGGLNRIQPSYLPGVVWADLRKCLPDYVINTLCEAIVDFDKKIKGFAAPYAVLTGVETRTSAPVRLIRTDETLQATRLNGLYLTGEGAGYAGGIVSAAVDGIRCAQYIMGRYRADE